jgi:hypothetical protein
MLCLLPRKDVIFDSIVAEAARVPPLAGSALQLDIAAVVPTAESSLVCLPFLFLLLLLLLLPWAVFHAVGRGAARGIGGPKIVLGQREVERCGPIAERVPKHETVQRPCWFRSVGWAGYGTSG